MLSRRNFLQRAAALVALGVAADQIELLERLGPRPKLWAGYRTPHIAYELKLLNNFQSGYEVRGADWRFDVDGFTHAARMTGRDVHYSLARDIYSISERTKSPWVFTAPGQLLNRDIGSYGPMVSKLDMH